jgi:hypothetical protein
LLSTAVSPLGSVGRVVVATEPYSRRRGEQPDASLTGTATDTWPVRVLNIASRG